MEKVKIRPRVQVMHGRVCFAVRDGVLAEARDHRDVTFLAVPI